MLQDIVDQFVVNPESRGLDGGLCQYNPAHPKISPGCAIGMYLDTKTAKKLDNIGPIDYVFSVEKHILLPNWMLKLGKEFLEDIQIFHDTDSNFTRTGISFFGLENLRNLCTKYKLKLPKINKINMP